LAEANSGSCFLDLEQPDPSSEMDFDQGRDLSGGAFAEDDAVEVRKILANFDLSIAVLLQQC
jgi:hypothetical protein